jgi:hypothetical protein
MIGLLLTPYQKHVHTVVVTDQPLKDGVGLVEPLLGRAQGNGADELTAALRQAGRMPWTPYADWIFTVVSTGSILLIAWLVLRPRP